MYKILLGFLLILSGCVNENDKIRIQINPPSTNSSSDITVFLDNSAPGSEGYNNILVFGINEVSGSKIKTIEIKNPLNLPTNIDFNSIALPYRIIENTCSTLPANGSCFVSIEGSFPEIGQDPNQTLEISYGGNTYKVRLNPESTVTVTCPANFINQSGVCIQDPSSITCSIGYSNQNGVCVQDPIVVTCDAGFIEQNGVCIQDVNSIICPNGYSNVSGACVQDPIVVTCDAGFVEQNGVCVQDINSITCPSGYSNQNGICVQNPVIVSCPQGFINQNDVCVQDTNSITCPSGYSNQNGICVQDPVVVSCPANFTEINGVCVQNENILNISYGIIDESIELGTPVSFSATRIGGTAPYSYSIQPALPSGLQFNLATGLISGNPNFISSRTQYVVSVSDALNASSQYIFHMETKVSTPFSLSYQELINPLYIGSSYEFLPSLSGGIGIIYNLSNYACLSSGLNFDQFSGRFYGIPFIEGEFSCSIQSQDIFGRIAISSFNYEVIQVPLTLAYTANEYTIPVGSAFSISPIIEGIEATDNLSFYPSPAFSRGLIIDPLTGVISGTINGLGEFSENILITVVVNGVRNTSVSILFNYSYIPELASNTITVEQISPDFIRIESVPNAPQATIYLANDFVKPYTTIFFETEEDREERFNLNFEPQPAPAVLIGTQIVTNPSLSESAISNAPIENQTISPIQAEIYSRQSTFRLTNTGNESVNDCSALRSDDNAVAGGYCYPLASGESRDMNVNFTNNVPSFENSSSFIIRVVKQFGNMFDFVISSLSTPAIQQKQISISDFFGEQIKIGFNYEEVIELGTKKPFDEISLDSFEYNNKLYFRLAKSMGSPSSRSESLATWDGEKIEEVLKLVDLTQSPYFETFEDFKKVDNFLYFITNESNGNNKLFRFNLDTEELISFNESSLSSNRYHILKGGLLFGDGGIIAYYDFSDNKKYNLLNQNPSYIDYNQKILDIAEDEFVFGGNLAFTTTGSGIFYVQGREIRKISNISDGSNSDSCYVISKNGPHIHLGCQSYSNGPYKLFNYNSLTNVISQTTNLRGNTINDISPLGSSNFGFAIKDDGSFYFISGNVDIDSSKMYKVSGTTVSRVTNFSGSNNTTDNLAFDTSAFVYNNKLYFNYFFSGNVPPGFENGTIVEMDTETDTITRLIPYLYQQESFFSGQGIPFIDNLGNMYYKGRLFKPNGEILVLNINPQNIISFRDGKILFHPFGNFTFSSKYMMFDGSNVIQISNTTENPSLSDVPSFYPFANYYQNKIIINGANSLGDMRLFEISLPEEFQP